MHFNWSDESTCLRRVGSEPGGRAWKMPQPELEAGGFFTPLCDQRHACVSCVSGWSRWQI